MAHHIVTIDPAPERAIDICPSVIDQTGTRHLYGTGGYQTRRALCGVDLDMPNCVPVAASPVMSGQLCPRCHQRLEVERRGSVRDAWSRPWNRSQR